MVYAAKRGKTRCPTHPGALLRDDIIPATGRTKAEIAGLLGILLMPWKLVADPGGYIFKWLIGYSALLGPIGGVMIADYFVVRRQKLEVSGLYSRSGPYGAVRWTAMAALLLAILPHAPGFLVQVDLVPKAAVPALLQSLYNFSWFSGFAIAFVLYLVFEKLRSR